MWKYADGYSVEWTGTHTRPRLRLNLRGRDNMQNAHRALVSRLRETRPQARLQRPYRRAQSYYRVFFPTTILLIV